MLLPSLATWQGDNKHVLNKGLGVQRAGPPHHSPPLRPLQDRTHSTCSVWRIICCLDFPWAPISGELHRLWDPSGMVV